MQNRRGHGETISCYHCGPQLQCVVKDGFKNIFKSDFGKGHFLKTAFLNSDNNSAWIDSDSKKLESVYGKKELGVSCSNPYNFDESVYCKYNPIFFEKDLINQLILKHIGKIYKIIEDNGNFVLLTGYLNVDLLKNPEGFDAHPLFEIKNSIELGELTAFIQISRKEIKQDEDEKPEE